MHTVALPRIWKYLHTYVRGNVDTSASYVDIFRLPRLQVSVAVATCSILLLFGVLRMSDRYVVLNWGGELQGCERVVGRGVGNM